MEGAVRSGSRAAAEVLLVPEDAPVEGHAGVL
jgi:monoamine oxidase